MTLASGLRLGPYEVLSHLGAGGMGEVYRARDTRLDRTVVIKVLPAAVADSPERRARFEREARAIAALSHPHICSLFDVGQHDGLDYLVMEYVEGQTLADRLEKGPLPLEQVLRHGRAIASTLDKAHRAGIVHRDLKPGNVMLNKAGVKLLDFGLAKLRAPGGTGTLSALATAEKPLTGEGKLMGTLPYMSPEQVEGKEADPRSDIWALGTVLYEMATGQRAFEGKSQAGLIGAILKDEPRSISSLQPLAPPALERAVKACLEKDPDDRWQSAHDVVKELKWISESSREVRIEIDDHAASPRGPLPSQTRSRTAQIFPWALAAALAILLLLAIWRPWTPSSAAAPAMRLDVRLGAGERLVVNVLEDGPLAVLSPDGRTIVYAATRDSVRRLYVRPLDSLESRPLSGTEGALSHFFSPDGRWVAFFSGDMLRKVAITGGAPVTIAPTTDARGGTWGPDDTIVFTPDLTAGLYRVPAAGGTPVEITKPAENERTHRWPWFLPDGNAVLFVRQDHDAAFDDGFIEAVRLDTKERKILIRGGTFPRYLASGHLVYAREGTLHAVPFDAKRLEIRGHAQPVLSGVLSSGGVGSSGGDGSSQVAFSTTGIAAYIAGSSGGTHSRSSLVIVDRSGKPIFTHPEEREFRDPRFSPDGTRVGLRMGDGKSSHVYVVSVDRATMTKVTFDGTENGLPTWSPDGRRLAYYSDRVSGGLNIFLTRSDGAGKPEALTTGVGPKLPSSFSPDGRLLAAMQQGSTSMDVVVLSLADKQLQPFAATPALELFPAFSPDGKWIAYESDESGSKEVYVRPYPGPGGKWVISAGGGLQPVWTKGGRELVYLAGLARHQFMAVEISVDGDAIRASKPQLLFEMPVAPFPEASWYDVTADGSRFVVLKANKDAPTGGFTHVTFVFNFFDEVRRALAGR